MAFAKGLKRQERTRRLTIQAITLPAFARGVFDGAQKAYSVLVNSLVGCTTELKHLSGALGRLLSSANWEGTTQEFSSHACINGASSCGRLSSLATLDQRHEVILLGVMWVCLRLCNSGESKLEMGLLKLKEGVDLVAAAAILKCLGLTLSRLLGLTDGEGTAHKCSSHSSFSCFSRHRRLSRLATVDQRHDGFS